MNKQHLDSRWLLTRRFFLSDRQPDVQSKGELVRIHALVALQVRLQVKERLHNRTI